MPRNTELSRLRTNSLGAIHPNACSPVGDWAHVEPTGAFTISIPDGANGVLMQQEGSGDCWFCFNSSVTDAGQGFLVPTGKLISQFWFDPKVTTTLYGYNGANSDFHYQFIKSPVYF